MKTFAFILSLIVMILSMSPCCVIEDHMEAKSASILKQQQTQTEDCCFECSPFYTCGTCGGFTVITMFGVSSPSPIQITNPLNSIYLQAFADGIDQNIWQPPKLSS